MHNEIRKLAAVMFTDLEGYTSMFQKNEASALDKIHIHRKYLDEITHKFHGQIIQFYGDGSLVVFDSVIDAIQCAIELQQVSGTHQLPLRIGIHIGDVVFKGSDIFGDAVNVASRIQSVGVPGSIVISRKVVDELKNQPDINTLRLGQYLLKNVNERVEVFAISGHGLIVPAPGPPVRTKQKTILYLILGAGVILAYLLLSKAGIIKSGRAGIEEDRIAIPPFENLTAKPEFNLIGEVASGIITHDLNESSNADVVSVTSGLLYTNADMASMIRNPALARQTGATNLLKGSYSFTGASQDSLVFWASVIDIKKTRTLENGILLATIPKIYCSADNPMDCIRELSDIIRGFWKSKGDNVFSYPDYDAYLNYLRARKFWASPDPEVQKKAKDYLLLAIKEDSLFLDAYFLLLDGFSNENNFKNELDTIQLIRRRFTELTDRQENYLKYYEEELNGRNREVYQHFIKEYPHDPKDLFNNTTGMVLANEYLNDPRTALAFNKNINLDSLDLRTCTYCRTTVVMAMQAYAELSDTINAGHFAEKLKPFAEKSAQYTFLIAYYMSIRDTASVNDVIEIAAKNSTPDDDDYQYYSFLAGRYAALNGNIQLRDYYAIKAIEKYGTNSTRTLGRCYYLIGDLNMAEKILAQEIQKRPDNMSLNADLGLVYAKQGNIVKANEIIDKLGQMEKEYDLGQTPYLQARIKAVLGENEAAIKYLNTALDQGIKFRVGTTFQHDPDLMSLKKDEKYLSLIIRNRQTKQ